jgi:hypothetical protein
MDGWGGLAFRSFLRFEFFAEEPVGGGGSVRRRNTLHVVGGRQCYCHKRGLWGEILFIK